MFTGASDRSVGDMPTALMSNAPAQGRTTAREAALLCVPWNAMLGLSLFPSRPVLGPSPMVGQGDHTQILASDIVDDAVRELTQGHAASISLSRAKLCMMGEQTQGSLELCNEGKTQVGAAFPGIE
jgi:hypothetical protein